MPNTFFKIGATDFTAYEDIQNHSVNREDVFSTWTDGNWIEHRTIARTRINGTVTLGFRTAAEHTAFLSALAAARSPDGFYSVSVYCNNTGSLESISAFLSLSESDKWGNNSVRQWRVVTISISEA